jgi:hypothetical protein
VDRCEQRDARERDGAAEVAECSLAVGRRERDECIERGDVAAERLDGAGRRGLRDGALQRGPKRSRIASLAGFVVPCRSSLPIYARIDSKRDFYYRMEAEVSCFATRGWTM